MECTKCGDNKPHTPEFFNWHTKPKRLRKTCRACDRVVRNDYRKLHAEEYRHRSYEWNRIKSFDPTYRKQKSREAVERRRKWFLELKKDLCCVVCGESHPYCLEFHHIDPKTKGFSGNKGIGSLQNRRKILEEIKKCRVLCANCHRKEHYPYP